MISKDAYHSCLASSKIWEMARSESKVDLVPESTICIIELHKFQTILQYVDASPSSLVGHLHILNYKDDFIAGLDC